MRTHAQRTPIAFVDRDGYVTPFNGRIVDNLPGIYLYNQAEVNFYVEEQRRMEIEREEIRRGMNLQEAAETAVANVSQPNLPMVGGEASPPPPPMVPAAAVAGTDSVVPPVPQVPKYAVSSGDPTTIPPSYVNLTQEEREQLPGGVNAEQAQAQVFSRR